MNLPTNVWKMPGRSASSDDPQRTDEALATAVPQSPRKPYDMRGILGMVVDRGSIFEMGRHQGPSQITALARLRELHEQYGAIASPFRTAEAFGIEDIIDPRETRPLLCEWVEAAYDAEKPNLGPKKRGMRC